MQIIHSPQLYLEDAKWKKSELVVVATPSPIDPSKTTLGLLVIHCMPGAQCRGPQTCPNPHPPTVACDPYNNTLVIATGPQTETFKTTTAHASNRSTFSISRSVTTPTDPSTKGKFTPESV